jgi:ubiquinone/menaquinone biosynthesis C-methylase UbiE
MSNPAETYENSMAPVLFRPWASALLDAAKPKAGERLLDVGCGTGIVARLAASQIGPGGKIAGVDLNPNMLAVARSMAEREALAIEWREGRAEFLPFPDKSFDLALCQFALMFFADQHAALVEMRRVLVEGGRLLLSVWEGLDRHPFYQKLHDVIRKRAGISGVQEIFGAGDAVRLRELLKNAGFRQIEIHPMSMTARFPNPEGFLAGEIDLDTAAIPSMQHLDAEERRAITTAIGEEMKTALDEVTEANHVVIPFYANIVRAER